MMAVWFDGETYDPGLDEARIATLLDRVRHHAPTGWHTLGELVAKCGGSEASVSARLRDLRKDRFGGLRVERRRRGDAKRGVFEYRVTP